MSGFCPIVSIVNRLIFVLAAGAACCAPVAAQSELKPALETTYQLWRDSMVRRDVAAWQRLTARHRQMDIRNRLVSEKRAFPAAVFEVPIAPPTLSGLKLLQITRNGATAKAVYFGKIDFGVEGEPTENLLCVSFLSEGGAWRYDKAEFVNLSALPAVRKELAAGELKYLKETPEANADGKVPEVPIAVNPAKTVAKVYVFCPGREVDVQINKVSRHKFTNAKEAELVLGGAKDGPNELQFAIRKLDGGTGKEAMTIRVYLAPEAEGVKPLKVFEYQVAENGRLPQDVGTKTFEVDAAALAKLKGK
jgi:hypothetical protein